MALSKSRPAVNTQGVTDRRVLRFETIEQAMADAEKICVAARNGMLKRTGNWSAGQTFGHLAAWINFGFNGYPGIVPPELAKAARERKEDVLKGPMITGIRIAGIDDGTWGTEDLLLDDGLAKLRNAWARLRSSAPASEHILFGDLSHSEWIALNLRHAELHHGFLIPLGHERR